MFTCVCFFHIVLIADLWDSCLLNCTCSLHKTCIYMHACIQNVTKIYLTKIYKRTRGRNGTGGETTNAWREKRPMVKIEPKRLGGGGNVLGRNDLLPL